MARAAIVRPDIGLADRQAALATLGDTPEQRARALMQAVKIKFFDPALTAEAITPLLLGLPNEGAYAISDELDALLDSEVAGLRSAAVALKVRAGASLDALAQRDPEALLDAVAALPADQAPDGISSGLIDLAEQGKLPAPLALRQAARLNNDTQAYFARLAGFVDRAREIGYDQWGKDHRLAMAALSSMNATPDEQWPAGFEDYQLAAADPETFKLGHAVYHHEEKGCIKCHGTHGQGTEGFPALAGAPWVLGDPQRATSIVKFGLKGELVHTKNPANGQPFNAQMEPLSYLSDADIAAVLTYVRQSWGNYASPVSIDDVKAARAPKEGQMMWQAEDLLRWYPFERDRVTGSLPGPTLKVQSWKAPSMGVVYMLVVVTLMMAAILLPTWLGGRPPSDGPHGAALA